MAWKGISATISLTVGDDLPAPGNNNYTFLPFDTTPAYPVEYPIGNFQNYELNGRPAK